MNRLTDLHSYDILDTDTEVEMNEIAEMAKVLFEVPISVISFIDDKRQWYKSKIGTPTTEVPLEDTFCRFTLDQEDKVLLVVDPLTDERFAENPYVKGENGIRFYVSAPIVSPLGNVLGTVCVWDFKKHQIRQVQLDALKLLARRVMIMIQTRKILKEQGKEVQSLGDKLKKLTDLSPGALFKIGLKATTGKLELEFSNDGIRKLVKVPGREENNLSLAELFVLLPAPAKFGLVRGILQSGKTMEPFEQDIQLFPETDHPQWLWVKVNPDRYGQEISFYGSIHEISDRMEHLKSLETILFDISHKFRSPVARIKGLIEMVMDERFSDTEKKELFGFLSYSTEELDLCLRKLNDEYFERKNTLMSLEKLAAGNGSILE